MKYFSRIFILFLVSAIFVSCANVNGIVALETEKPDVDIESGGNENVNNGSSGNTDENGIFIPPADIYVAEGGTGDGSSYKTPSGSTLQEVVNAADSGDTIAITGTFIENVIITDKALAFVGYGENGAIVNGDHAGSVFTINGTKEGVLFGNDITLTNGIGTGGNNAEGLGSAINIKSGTVVLNGSVITGNGSPVYGHNGTVYVSKGSQFIMASGSISENYAYAGAGVFVDTEGTFTMTGGEITNNTAGFGGGLLINRGDTKGGSASMSGGVIKDNKLNIQWGSGQDVRLGGASSTVNGNGSSFEVSGDAHIGTDPVVAKGGVLTYK